jgi:hypothetical protein
MVGSREPRSRPEDTKMRAQLVFVTAALLVPTARADDPKLPASMDLPFTALAKASTDPKGGATITLRVVATAPAIATKKVIEYRAVIKEVNGKQVTEQVPVEREVPITVMKPTGWREVKIGTGEKGVSFHDTAGKPVAADKVVTLLAKEVPVLVAAEPIDPFHLLTTKEGTLVLVVPPHLLFPPAPEPILVPKKP